MRFFLMFIITVLTINLTAQKVDIDNTSTLIEYCSLPHHKIPAEDRTYSLSVSGTYKLDKQEVENALNLRGWKWQQDGGTVLVKIKLSDFVRGRSSSSKRVQETKNKEGKVTSRTTYHKYSSTNTGRAYMTLFGPSNPYKKSKKATSNKNKKKTKAELRKEAREKEKADNPFLKNAAVDVNAEEESQNEANEVASFNLTQSYVVAGRENKSVKGAYDSYNSIADLRYSEQKDQYVNNVINSANTKLNQTYGYRKNKVRARFKKLDSKKHPEFEMYTNATNALKELFKQKKFNRNFDDVTISFEPIIAYFSQVVEKYSKKDKHSKRLKAASMYNLAQIYYYLDQPEKVIEIGNSFIRWDYETRDGKRFVKKGEELKSLLDFHGVDGRYFTTEENADEVETDEESTEED